MNPYDALDLDTNDSPETIRAALERAAATAPQAQRSVWQAHLRAFESQPELRFIWLLTSRSMGGEHLFDRALRALSDFHGEDPQIPDEEALSDHTRSSLDDPKQRRAVLTELTELPDLPKGQTFKTGLLGWDEG